MSSDATSGYLAVVTAGFFFGSNFVPVKQYDAGNGFFFQVCMCNGVLFVGVCLHCFLGFPDVPKKLYAIFGGLMWYPKSNGIRSCLRVKNAKPV